MLYSPYLLRECSMIIKCHPTIRRAVLLFIAAGLVWTFGIKHLFLEEKLHLFEPGHTLTSDLFSDHLPDFLFITLAAWLLYRMINTNYRHLSEANARLLQHERQIRKLYDKEHYLRGIMGVIRDINGYLISAKEIDELGKMSCQRLARHSDYRLVWIGKIEKGKIVVKYYSTDLTGYLDFKSMPLPEELKTTNCPICTAIREDQTVIVNDVDDPTLPDKLRAAVENGIYSLVSLPLKSHNGDGDKVFGAMNIYSARVGGFQSEEVSMLEELAGDIGFAIHAFEEEEEHRRLEREKLRNYEQTLFSMIDLIESRDSYTAGHTKRVARYSAMIAEAMGYGTEKVEQLRTAAMLHDIGKIQTPDAILLKPGRLSDYEYELIQEHVNVGYTMLRRIDMYKELAEIIRYHHERYDGSGYPDGIKGDDIPPLSRIMIVADAFDAMTTSRIYKSRMQLEDAIAELQRCAGSQFHPEVVEVATGVLATIQLDPAHQLPTSRIDNERLAYFYKDRLTGAFSYDYLQVVLDNAEVFGRFRYACGLFLHGFTKLNREQGWSYGDWVLQSLGSHLTRTFSNAIVFRRFGDDFLLLSKEPFPCAPATLKAQRPLADTALDLSLIQIDLEHEGILTADGIEACLASRPPSVSLPA
jgi:two-component system sensor histidine kinase TtrS